MATSSFNVRTTQTRNALRAMAAASKGSPAQSLSKSGKHQQRRPYDPSLDAFWRVHFFSSFFLQTQRKEATTVSSVGLVASISSPRTFILFPINLGNAHWVCGAINFRRRRFEYYDSMGTPNPKAFELMRHYVTQEQKTRRRRRSTSVAGPISSATRVRSRRMDMIAVCSQHRRSSRSVDETRTVLSRCETPVISWKGESLDEGAGKLNIA